MWLTSEAEENGETENMDKRAKNEKNLSKNEKCSKARRNKRKEIEKME